MSARIVPSIIDPHFAAVPWLLAFSLGIAVACCSSNASEPVGPTASSGGHAASGLSGAAALGGVAYTAGGGAATPPAGGSGGQNAANFGGTSNAGGATSTAIGGATSGGVSPSAAGSKALGGNASQGGAGGKGLGGNASQGGAGGKALGGNASQGGAGGKALGGNTSLSGAGSKATGGAPAMGGSRGKATGGSGVGGSAGASSSTDCLNGPAAVVPAGYQLIWADEFNVDGTPSAANWGYESGFVRNEEAQWYQPNNARVESGCLIIEGRRERKTNPNYQAGSTDWKTNRQYAEYTSSSLRSMGKQFWQFGRFEMRGRIKAQAGLWPAWWTLGVAKEWPSCGEIDIMEYYAGMIRANVATGTSTRWQAKWDGAAWNVSTFDDKDWQNKFHVWRMDWDDLKIDLLLDDKLVNTSSLSDMLNPDGSSPFRQAHYMILNLALGGVNGGDPTNTAFPTRFEVDYVRVFQKL